MDLNGTLLMKRYNVERDEGWRDMIPDIPDLQFREDWKVKVIPPFGGAMARFIVSKNNKSVSVYYDTMDRLGFYESPYFEAYPIDGDTARFSNNEVDLMMETIERELNKE